MKPTSQKPGSLWTMGSLAEVEADGNAKFDACRSPPKKPRYMKLVQQEIWHMCGEMLDVVDWQFTMTEQYYNSCYHVEVPSTGLFERDK